MVTVGAIEDREGIMRFQFEFSHLAGIGLRGDVVMARSQLEVGKEVGFGVMG